MGFCPADLNNAERLDVTQPRMTHNLEQCLRDFCAFEFSRVGRRCRSGIGAIISCKEATWLQTGAWLRAIKISKSLDWLTYVNINLVLFYGGAVCQCLSSFVPKPPTNTELSWGLTALLPFLGAVLMISSYAFVSAFPSLRSVCFDMAELVLVTISGINLACSRPPLPLPMSFETRLHQIPWL